MNLRLLLTYELSLATRIARALAAPLGHDRASSPIFVRAIGTLSAEALRRQLAGARA